MIMKKNNESEKRKIMKNNNEKKKISKISISILINVIMKIISQRNVNENNKAK